MAPTMRTTYRIACITTLLSLCCQTRASIRHHIYDQMRVYLIPDWDNYPNMFFCPQKTGPIAWSTSTTSFPLPFPLTPIPCVLLPQSQLCFLPSFHPFPTTKETSSPIHPYFICLSLSTPIPSHTQNIHNPSPTISIPISHPVSLHVFFFIRFQFYIPSLGSRKIFFT